MIGLSLNMKKISDKKRKVIFINYEQISVVSWEVDRRNIKKFIKIDFSFIEQLKIETFTCFNCWKYVYEIRNWEKLQPSAQ